MPALLCAHVRDVTPPHPVYAQHSFIHSVCHARALVYRRQSLLHFPSFLQRVDDDVQKLHQYCSQPRNVRRFRPRAISPSIRPVSVSSSNYFSFLKICPTNHICLVTTVIKSSLEIPRVRRSPFFHWNISLST